LFTEPIGMQLQLAEIPSAIRAPMASEEAEQHKPLPDVVGETHDGSV
jgi:hypothetical protein